MKEWCLVELIKSMNLNDHSQLLYSTIENASVHNTEPLFYLRIWQEEPHSLGNRDFLSRNFLSHTPFIVRTI